MRHAYVHHTPTRNDVVRLILNRLKERNVYPTRPLRVVGLHQHGRLHGIGPRCGLRGKGMQLSIVIPFARAKAHPPS
jgi:hypothetical protein